MPRNIESLSDVAKGELLARVAHRLTVCARCTYEAGTENVLEPQLLRAFNELLHRVTAAVSQHIREERGLSLESIVEMIQDFGVEHNFLGLTSWVTEPVASYMDSPKSPYPIN